MTLVDLIQNLPVLTYDEAKHYALVFGNAAAEALRQAQATSHSQHRVSPVQLSDGRWMICADVLTELHPGGLLAGGLALLPEELFPQVAVMPWAEAVALLPQPEPQPERARDELGRFMADDPATADVDEAWVTTSPSE